MLDKASRDRDLGVVSLLLRLAVSCLFYMVARNQMQYGYIAISSKMRALFSGLLPSSLIGFTSKTICLAQLVIAIWLFTGIRLRWAWISSGIFMVTLCFGLLILKQYNHVYGNYLYFYLYINLNL